MSLAALNVYKKIAIVRRSTDTLTFEDEDGNVHTVSNLGEAASTTNPSIQPKPKDEILVPRIITVEDYEKNIPPTYEIPVSYVRHRRSTPQEKEEALEYLIDAEDEVWLLNNSKFGGSALNDDRKRPQLPLDFFERMMDIMEKETGFETIITVDQAERAILAKIPELLYLFPTKAKAGVVTLKHVLHDIYTHWVQKRSKLKRPLLRRFWPVTACDDTNPHLVFRPREKEKYKLRKKRQNDMDAFLKMKQLRLDFERVRDLLELVKRREELKRFKIIAQLERFEQQMYDICDTSGLPRVSNRLRREAVKALLETPHYFDIVGGGAKRKRGRPNMDSLMPNAPAPATHASQLKDLSGSSGPPIIVAGQNGGEPAPLFLHPLKTRESYVTSWHNAVPFIASYENSRPTPTFRFRHRPRVGRGGRLCIDRMPLPVHDEIPPQTIFTAGHRLPMTTPKNRLLDLMPPPIDHIAVSKKIEDMCAAAIREDVEAAAADPEENGGDEVVVRLKDWLGTDDQLWGDERFAIGPI